MAAIEKSDLVIYSGAGLEPWTQGFHFKSKVIDMSKNVKLRELKTNEFEHHEHHDAQCAHSSIDPHYWFRSIKYEDCCRAYNRRVDSYYSFPRSDV